MCGIAGFIDAEKKSSYANLLAMTDVLSHRGPDGSGYELIHNNNSTIGLGHRRLSIIDLHETGKQPMIYRNWCIVFNGEIYNYKEIKSELENKGRTFTSSGDTEVILQGFDEWGIKVVNRFIGMFAFVIYNKELNTAYMFRDRVGVKPFYYYFNNGLFLFASELKAFHHHPGFVKEINSVAFSKYIQYGYIQGPDTIFQNTFKLNAGHYIEFNVKTSSLSINPYWSIFDFYNQPKVKITEQEAVTETEKILISACNYRMLADVPVGVFLSGGYDSSIVTALLQKETTEKIKTFTIGFNIPKFNEANYAKEVSKHLKTDHTEYYCSTNEAQSIIPELPFYYDEPFADSSAIPTILVSRLAKKNVTVALSADGGDELFAGYETYTHALKLKKLFSPLPHYFRKSLETFLKTVPAYRFPILNKLIGTKDNYNKLVNCINAKDIVAVKDVLNSHFCNREIECLLNPAVSDNLKTLTLDNNNTDIENLLVTDYTNYMVDDILVKVDRASMSCSLEGREPLLDHRLAEWVAKLPAAYKYKDGIKKYLLKKITHQYLPEELMNRPKMGFGVPVYKWLKNELKYLLDEYINDKELSHLLFNKQYVFKLKHDFLNDKQVHFNKLWIILMFQMWYKKWM